MNAPARDCSLWTRLVALVASGFVLVGCGGGGGGGSSEPPPAPAKPPVAQATSASLNVWGATASSVSGRVTASDPQGLALTYTVATPPTVGAVSVDLRSGTFTYSLSGDTTRSQDSFTVMVSNGQASSVNAVVTVQLNTDPLLVNQWHIRNVGAAAFSTTLPVAGNDMNVAGAWAAGFTGRGIKVAVVDSGLEMAHEDLAANVDAANSFNFLTGTNDPTRATSDPGVDHGTQVAGIIGAAAFNGKGGRGVAFNARLRGYNLIAAGAYSAVNYGRALGGMPVSEDNAVFNTSFHTNPLPTLPPTDEVINAAHDSLRLLRGGLGAVLVSSAGNDFQGFSGADPGLCAIAKSYKVSCGDPATDTRRGGQTPIIVGAINAEGKHSSYSNTGSSLWVSAPGGEYGFDSAYSTLPNLSADELKPAIVTTARPGCPNRSNVPDVANAVVTGNNRFALNCQYTATMNGTSSASPNVAATVALMLEANPKLAARDVKFILAKTARMIDPTLAGVTSTTFAPGSTITVEQGWVRNAAGYPFSNTYGFGAVDTSKAVEMARGYTNYLSAAKAANYDTTPGPGLIVPAKSASGLEFTKVVNEPFTTVEQLVVYPNIEATPSLWCNQIEVVSPSGTKSIVLHAGSGFAQTSATNSRILSNAFYGEPLNGTWKLTYFNFCPGQARLSSTQTQRLRFIGR